MNKFLNREELKEKVVEETRKENNVTSITNGAFSWSSNEPPFLREINFEISSGQLSAVVGSVGSGKSSLLAALLGELKECGGEVVRCRNTAYLPQQAWVQNSSIRDNILFCQVICSIFDHANAYMKEMDEERYREVLESCELLPDLAILPQGDLTEVCREEEQLFSILDLQGWRAWRESVWGSAGKTRFG